MRATGAGLLEGEPKTARSRRTISVGSEAVSILKAVRVQQAEQRLKAGAKWQDLGYVFTQASGRPLDPDDASGRFAELVRELNLAHLTLHGLRHAHATLLIKQGVHLKVVQERMGHSSITVTADLYGHLLPGMDAEAAGRLDQLLTKGDPARLSASGNFRPIGRK
ncbi:MAG: site-specific integrase [SAR202 cluster bacterium]|nr:site-specific integrase [SAR202 cluster bacterium]